VKLYHASPIENEESISEHGLVPNSTDNGFCAAGQGDTLQGKSLTGVYGFVTLRDAIHFVEDNRGIEFNAIFVFDVPDGCNVIADPEYTDNEAVFVVTDEPIAAVKVEIFA
jgi:hypothetical protein